MSPIRRTTATLSTLALLLSGGLLAGSPAIAAPLAPAEINVMDAPYNAVGDGVTSDSVAIQDALDDAAGSGATVLIPAGHAFLTGGVTVGSGTTLKIDGTLLQSQNIAHYSYTPAKGHRPGPIKNDLSMFVNLPFVFATHSTDVKVVGDGVVQLTRAATEAETIHAVGIGFYEVTGFEIRDVEVLGSSAYSLALYSSRSGIVANTRIIPSSHVGSTPDVADANTDGVSIMNAQNIRVTGNYLRTSDDGIYIVANYKDPRGVDRWWSTDVPQASRFIEFDDNDVSVTCCKAFTFIAWGIDAPDQRTVEISDIYVHDNKLAANGDAVGCWCDARYANSNASLGQSSITRVRFENNEYTGKVNNTFSTAQITDLKTDFGALGSRFIQNGDFEKTGISWWTAEAANGADVDATDLSNATALRSPEARLALEGMDGWAGFLQPSSSATVRLVQGIGMTAQAMPSLPFDTSRYQFSADVVTSGDPVRVFVHNTCTGRDIAETVVTSATRTRVELPFSVSAVCENIRLGFEASGDASWALVDNVAIDYASFYAVDDDDPSVTYVGSWVQYPNADAWGGTNGVSRVPGEYMETPFSGSRAVLLGGIDHNLGILDVYLDGVLVATVDLYSPVKLLGQVTYDTGEITDGDHILKLVNTGRKNPASLGYVIAFDALLVASAAPDTVPPTVSVALSHGGSDGWFTAGVEATVTATDVDSGVNTVEYQIDDGAWVSYAGPVALADGEYTVSARAADVAGNVSEAVSRVVKVDALAPEVWVWMDDAGAASAFARDLGASGVDRIEYSLDDGDSWLGGLSALIAEEPKPITFLYRAVDVAGNIGAEFAAARAAAPAPLMVSAGESVYVEFSGFQEGQQVRVELHSDPVLLSTLVADGNGVISGFATVSDSLESGVHSLVATVVPAASGGGDGVLGSTGVEPMPWVIGGMLVLMIGAGALLVSRRRMKSLN